MPELILDPRYWSKRYRDAPKDQLHHAIFKCPLDKWLRIEEKHKQLLSQTVGHTQSVLDVGCGYGRLLNLLGPAYTGKYVGVDLCHEFIDVATDRYEHRTHPTYFLHGDILDVRFLPTKFVAEQPENKFDWAILISVRPMLIRHCGQEYWDRVEQHLRTIAHKMLFLEYDEDDNGTVITN